MSIQKKLMAGIVSFAIILSCTGKSQAACSQRWTGGNVVFESTSTVNSTLDECWAEGLALGLLLGLGVAVVVYFVASSNNNPTGFTNMEYPLVENSKFFYEPEIDFGDDKNIGFRTGLKW